MIYLCPSALDVSLVLQARDVSVGYKFQTILLRSTKWSKLVKVPQREMYLWVISITDDYDKIDYDKMARVTEGLKHVIKNLADKP